MRYFYHYGSLRSCRDWRNLRRLMAYNKLVLSSPERFNDPFDCRALFSLKRSDESCIRKFFAERYRIEHPDAKAEEPELVADLIIQNEWHRNSQRWQVRMEEVQKALEKQAACLRVYCLTEFYNKLLMWGHYADNHRGYCLQFSMSVLDSPDKLGKVKYKDYPTFTNYYYSDRKNSFFMLRKSAEWEYEQEWRLVYDVRDFGHEEGIFILRLPIDALVGIILGCAMASTSKKRIRKWAAERATEKHLRVFEARRSAESYSVVIDGLD